MVSFVGRRLALAFLLMLTVAMTGCVGPGGRDPNGSNGMPEFCPPPNIVVEHVDGSPGDGLTMSLRRIGEMGDRRFLVSGGGLQSRIKVYDGQGNLRGTSPFTIDVLRLLQMSSDPVEATFVFADAIPVEGVVLTEVVVSLDGAYALAPVGIELDG